MISLTNVTMDLGVRLLFSNVTFLVQRGDRIGLVGRNGAGKSTLLHIISGDRNATSGHVGKQNGISLGLLSQDLTLDLSSTLRETAMQAFVEVLALHDKIEELQHELVVRTDYETDAYMDVVQGLTDANDMYERKGGNTMHADIERILTGLGFEQADLDKNLTEFSGGWQMRAELGRLLLQRPDCLLLDEPTNHLDIDSVRWLEDFLRNYDGAIILVSHDRTFLDNVTNRTIEITRSRVYDIPASYSDYEEIRSERLDQQKAAHVHQQRERERVQKWVDRFRYKATFATRVQSRIKHLQKMEEVEIDDVDGSSMHFKFPPAPRSGRVVVDCVDLQKHYGPKQVLRNINFSMERQEKVAFIGKNGEGKTTLAKIIAGLEPLTGGECNIGYNTMVGYYAQHQADMLGGHNSVYEVMEQAAPPEMRTRIRALLGAFLFSGDDINKKVSVLSGGEKSRLALARLLLQPTNLLILDEPTNHLDMLSKEVLKQALMKYDGAMIVVSHDRDFLDTLTDKVIAFRKGELVEFEGDIDVYLQSLSQAPTAALKPVPVEAPSLPPVVKTKKAMPGTPSGEKERKRIEKRIAEIEAKTSVLEKQQQDLELQLAKPEMYKDPNTQKRLMSEYETIKRDVSALTEEWEACQEQLEEATT